MGWKKEQGRLGHMAMDAARWEKATTMRAQQNFDPGDTENYEMEESSRAMTKNNSNGAGPAERGNAEGT